MESILKNAAKELFGERHAKPPSLLKTMVPIRGLAILLVVLAHSVIGMLAAEVSLAPGSSLGPELFGAWRIASIPKSVILELCRFAVPVFLFLSGYFTLSTPLTWKAIWSNCRKLLLPMITWSLVGWALSWRNGSGWSPLEFLGLFGSGRTQAGYFFIVLITQYYVLTRWLVPAMKERPGLFLALAALIQLAVQGYDYLYLLSRLGTIAPIGWILKAGSFPEYLFPRFMLSFALGIWASQSNKRFRSIIVDRFPALLAAAALAAALLVLERGLLFRSAFAVLGMSEFESTTLSWVEWKASTSLWTIAATFLVFGWFQRRIPMKRLLDTLGKYSFQIFLLHGMVLDLAKAALYKFASGMRFYGFAGCALLLVIGIVGPILIAKAVQKLMPASVRQFLLGA
jgi:fucose 4-O-acetylase-like acetyltransferase